MSKVSEKFSIIKTVVDLEKLNEEIDKYMFVNDESPYIFMNEETINIVKKELSIDYTPLLIPNLKQPSRYCGCKVFPDNTLKFGVIEIR